MRETATTSRLPGLFKLAALAAVTVTLLVTSGCGKKRCGECNKCNSCNTCNTCTSCNTQSTCTTCGTADNSVPSSQYERVGQAPQSLSEPMSAPVQSNVYQPAPPAPTQSNATFDRVGASRDLPVFSPAPSAIPQSAPAPTPMAAPAPAAPAQLLPTTQPRSSGPQYHTLQKGETVYGISRQYGVSPKAVLAANHFSDPNRLSVGTKVMIPAN